MAENKEQTKAIRHFNGPCMVIAPPGSGKTFTIIRRLHYLMEEKGVPPREILVITFTKAAAEEMERRFLKESKAKNKQITFGTFHAVYFHILKQEYSYTFRNIITPSEKREILKTAMLSILPESEYSEDAAAEYLSKIEKQKNTLHQSKVENSSEEEIFQRIFKCYEKEKAFLKKVDFEDMAVLCVRLFTEKGAVLRKWQKKYRYLLIDEFQDINEMQFEVIRLLAGQERNVFAVGDDDQAIYGFRGASPEIMLKLPSVFEEITVITLPINYRSTQEIVNAAEGVISNNKVRYQKHSIAANGSGKGIQIYEAEQEEEEERFIVQKLKERNADKAAIIVRTNEEAEHFAELFSGENIAFSIKKNKKSFYEHFIVKEIFAYLKFALEGKNRSDFLKIMNKPQRYISREALYSEAIDFGQLRDFYKDSLSMQKEIEQLENQCKILSKLPLFAAINFIRKGMGYEEYLKEHAFKCHESYDEYYLILEKLQECAKGKKGIVEWLYEIKQHEENLKKNILMKSKQEVRGVKIITMHASKGLEFETVIIPSVMEGVIPYKMAQTEEEIEEERRLFFVAMTRAKEELILTYQKEKQDKSKEMSRFLIEMTANLHPL